MNLENTYFLKKFFTFNLLQYSWLLVKKEITFTRYIRSNLLINPISKSWFYKVSFFANITSFYLNIKYLFT